MFSKQIVVFLIASAADVSAIAQELALPSDQSQVLQR